MRSDVVICGAGIAGVAAAYFLSVKYGVRDVLIVDERAPLTLTSDKSTEAYRNWWPGPDQAMVSFTNRSIDLLEELAAESGNVFQLNRRGYVYATGEPARVAEFRKAAEIAEAAGAGPVRYHTGGLDDLHYSPAPAEGYTDQPGGADLILDQRLIRKFFPYLSSRTVAVLHVRRAGWFSGQQFGMYLLERAQAAGVCFMRGRVTGVKVDRDRVEKVFLSQEGRQVEVSTRDFVNAAGPFVKEVGKMLGIQLPVLWEKHFKASFQDHLGVFPRDAPLLIWEDPQFLPWTEGERDFLSESEETRWLLDPFPPSVHARPEGGPGSRNILILWPYHLAPVEPAFPLAEDPYFPEVVLRGMATMVPGLSAYFDRIPRPFVDGGYYTKTRENRLICGPLLIQGAWIIGALSGYGLMAACAAGELLAMHLTGSPLPSYAPAFSLDRYDRPAYRRLLESWGSSGQL